MQNFRRKNFLQLPPCQLFKPLKLTRLRNGLKVLYRRDKLISHFYRRSNYLIAGYGLTADYQHKPARGLYESYFSRKGSAFQLSIGQSAATTAAPYKNEH
jgi:hypothetical protein